LVQETKPMLHWPNLPRPDEPRPRLLDGLAVVMVTEWSGGKARRVPALRIETAHAWHTVRLTRAGRQWWRRN
jgi:hypothetical protein